MSLKPEIFQGNTKQKSDILYRFFKRYGIWVLKEKAKDFLKRNLIGCHISVLFIFLATVEK